MPSTRNKGRGGCRSANGWSLAAGTFVVRSPRAAPIGLPGPVGRSAVPDARDSKRLVGGEPDFYSMCPESWASDAVLRHRAFTHLRRSAVDVTPRSVESFPRRSGPSKPPAPDVPSPNRRMAEVVLAMKSQAFDRSVRTNGTARRDRSPCLDQRIEESKSGRFLGADTPSTVRYAATKPTHPGAIVDGTGPVDVLHGCRTGQRISQAHSQAEQYTAVSVECFQRDDFAGSCWTSWHSYRQSRHAKQENPNQCSGRSSCDGIHSF